MEGGKGGGEDGLDGGQKRAIEKAIEDDTIRERGWGPAHHYISSRLSKPPFQLHAVRRLLLNVAFFDRISTTRRDNTPRNYSRLFPVPTSAPSSK